MGLGFFSLLLLPAVDKWVPMPHEWALKWVSSARVLALCPTLAPTLHTEVLERTEQPAAWAPGLDTLHPGPGHLRPRQAGGNPEAEKLPTSGKMMNRA